MLGFHNVAVRRINVVFFYEKKNGGFAGTKTND